MLMKIMAGAALGLALATSAASAEVTVRVLHVNNNVDANAIWNQIARDFEKENAGVKIDLQYLENEAFKAKLPTLLQSNERPNIIYSWAGGVMEAQAEAGFLADSTADFKKFDDRIASAGVAAFTLGGKQYGIPFELSQVALWYNKALFKKADLDPASMKTWDGFLAGVKKLKAAGITPIVVGGGEKWPMHFYWSYLVMRIGGKDVLNTAKAGKDNGFKAAAFVEAGKRLKELADLDPFNQGWLGTTHAQSAGIFGDGKAAMDLMGNWLLGMQAPNSASGKGIPVEDIGILPFPELPGGKGKITDTLGGLQGWLITKNSPKEAVQFLDFFSQTKYQNLAAEKGVYIPAVKGTETSIKNPLVQQIAANILGSTWHQNFFDQDLGPSVGRVVNDVSVAIAAGKQTPDAAAAAIQDAWNTK